MNLLVHASTSPAGDGTILEVTPESAGWRYVGFEVLELSDGVLAERDTGEREVCLVVVTGRVHVRSEHGDWRDLGGRPDPWSGLPDAAYLPPGTNFSLTGAGEVALCWAPAPNGGAAARLLPGRDIQVEARGHGAHERFVRPILMGDREADSLLVFEVVTAAAPGWGEPPGDYERKAPHEE